MRIYVVYYNSWDTMELYYVGTKAEDAYTIMKYNADMYGTKTTYIQIWKDGVMLSDKNAKDVIENDLG